MKWLALSSGRYVTDVYMPNHDTQRPPPALNKTGAKYAKVSPNDIWRLMERANETGVSLAAAIALRYDDETVGANAFRCDLWMNKCQQMYAERASLGFPNVSHIPLWLNHQRAVARRRW